MNSVLARYLGTNDVVRDLDALRAAVGDRHHLRGLQLWHHRHRTLRVDLPTASGHDPDSVTAPQAVWVPIW